MPAPISTHPGEVLEDMLDSYGLSMSRLAREIRVPTNRITQIVKGDRAVTADTAIRLAAYFDMSARFWSNLQADYDLRNAVHDFKDEYGRIEPNEKALAETDESSGETDLLANAWREAVDSSESILKGANSRG